MIRPKWVKRLFSLFLILKKISVYILEMHAAQTAAMYNVVLCVAYTDRMSRKFTHLSDNCEVLG